MTSRHCSRLSIEWGVSLRASSELDDRVLVACFFLQTFTTRSSDFGLTPTIIPSYTSTPGPIKSLPRSWVLKSP